MTSYTRTARAFHWSMALLIFGVLALGLIAHDLPDSPLKIRLFFWHKSFGITIFGLVVLRLLWRFSHRPPPLPETMEPSEKRAAAGAHWLLYGLMVGLPLSGWLLNSAANFPLKVFGWFELPNLVAPSESLKFIAGMAHEYAAWLLMGLLAVHVMAALKHRYWDRDAVFAGMAIGIRPVLLLLAFGCTLFVIVWNSLPISPIETQAVSFAEPITQIDQPTTAGTATVWQMKPEQSRLGFSCIYDGVGFDGEFKRFEPQIQFSADDLAGSRFDVGIDVASVDSQNSERDQALSIPAWFDFKQFPQARFVAQVFSQTGEGQFVAQGQLTIRDITRPLALPFSWQRLGDEAQLQFNIELQRLDYDIGTGMWVDDIVGHTVNVTADLTLTQEP